MLQLDAASRKKLWDSLVNHIENYLSDVDALQATPEFKRSRLTDIITSFDLSHGMDPIEALNWVNQQLTQFQVHTPHPRYFGLFNPASSTMGIAADAMVAAFNPQLAAWSHSPFANEVERKLINDFGQRFGYLSSSIDGTFTTGGAEANHTALLSALIHYFPDYKAHGLKNQKSWPILYVSAESHHSLIKAAAMCGLGIEAVRLVPVDEQLTMDVTLLQDMIVEDRKKGNRPFMVVATGGTTNAGAIDPIEKIGLIAQKENLWFHLDAAWGGAVVLTEKYKSVLKGIGNADSITFDAHKWLSVPMGAGIYLTQHPDILSKTFSVQADYMPTKGHGDEVTNPFMHTMQWSRRFIGLKVFLSLAVAGWKGYSRVIEHQIDMGNYLKEQLRKREWEITNDTPLPIACFYAHSKSSEKIVSQVVSSGDAWISTTRLADSRTVIRACITNFKTEKADIDQLVMLLEEARKGS